MDFINFFLLSSLIHSIDFVQSFKQTNFFTHQELKMLFIHNITGCAEQSHVAQHRMILWHDTMAWYYGMIPWHDMMAWYYGMIPWHDTMAWYHGMIRWHDAMAWYHGMILWHDTMAWYHGMILWHDTMAWYYGMIPWHDTMAWCYGMIPWYDTMAWYHGMILWHDTMAWYDGMMLWHDTMVWYYGMIPWHDTMAWYHGMIRWHDAMAWYHGVILRHDTVRTKSANFRKRKALTFHQSRESRDSGFFWVFSVILQFAVNNGALSWLRFWIITSQHQSWFPLWRLWLPTLHLLGILQTCIIKRVSYKHVSHKHLIAEACVSLRLTLELFYFIGILVLLCYFDAWLNKIVQK